MHQPQNCRNFRKSCKRYYKTTVLHCGWAFPSHCPLRVAPHQTTPHKTAASFTPWATNCVTCRATSKFKVVKMCCAVNWVSCEAKPLRAHRQRFHQRFHCHKLAVFLYLLLETWFPKCSYFILLCRARSACLKPVESQCSFSFEVQTWGSLSPPEPSCFTWNLCKVWAQTVVRCSGGNNAIQCIPSSTCSCSKNKSDAVRGSAITFVQRPIPESQNWTANLQLPVLQGMLMTFHDLFLSDQRCYAAKPKQQLRGALKAHFHEAPAWQVTGRLANFFPCFQVWSLFCFWICSGPSSGHLFFFLLFFLPLFIPWCFCSRVTVHLLAFRCATSIHVIRVLNARKKCENWAGDSK